MAILRQCMLAGDGLVQRITSCHRARWKHKRKGERYPTRMYVGKLEDGRGVERRFLPEARPTMRSLSNITSLLHDISPPKRAITNEHSSEHPSRQQLQPSPAQWAIEEESQTASTAGLSERTHNKVQKHKVMTRVTFHRRVCRLPVSPNRSQEL